MLIALLIVIMSIGAWRFPAGRARRALRLERRSWDLHPSGNPVVHIL